MEEASEGMEKEKEVDDRVEEIRKKQNASQDTIDLYREVFQMLDFDGSQCIEAEELMMGLRMVGREPSPHELHAMMKRVDENDSGEIDFAEFVQFMFNLKADAAERRASLLSSTTPQLNDVPEEPTKMSADEMLSSVEKEGVARPEAVKPSARSNQVVPSG